MKMNMKNLAVCQIFHIFAPALSNGVMVAQQVLVLFVVVRIRLGQQKGTAQGPFFFFINKY